MNQQQPTNELENLKTYLADYLKDNPRYTSSKRFNNNFICVNPNHIEKRPSMSFNRKNNTCHCFSCQATYSLIDLIILDYELGDLNKPLEDRLKDKETIAKACNKIKELFNISGTAPVKSQYKPSNEPPKSYLYALERYNKAVYGEPTREYLNSRGLTDNSLIEQLGIKNSYEGDFGYLWIPYQIGEAPTVITTRIISYNLSHDLKGIAKEDRFKHYSKNKLITYDPFNYLSAKAPRIIFITEGELDAISIYQLLKELRQEPDFKPNYAIGSIALGGVNNTSDFFSKLETITKDNLRFILAVDNDARGKSGATNIGLKLRDYNIAFTDGIIPLEHKDANDYLQADKEGFKARIKSFIANIDNLCNETQNKQEIAILKDMEQAKEDYINQNSALSNLNAFNEHIANPIRPIRTHFKSLDNAFKGGLRPGLITIGAISSLGKTSFILQLADQIAQSRQADILYFSLEMAIDELIAKSLSRLMYLESNSRIELAKSQAEILNRGYWSKESIELYETAKRDFRTYAPKLYYKEGVANFGVEDIKAIALEHVRNTSQAPVIIIDYLQILASPKDKKGLSDKQKTDENIVLLKQLSRDLNTPIIVISSLNRASYNLDVDLDSFKESGAIEYTSDIILGLNYDLTEEQLNKLRQIKRDSRDLPDNEKQKAINDFLKEVRSKTPRNIKLDILKNRNGVNNISVNMRFYPNVNFFIENGAPLQDYNDLLEHSKTKKEEIFEDSIELPF